MITRYSLLFTSLVSGCNVMQCCNVILVALCQAGSSALTHMLTQTNYERDRKRESRRVCYVKIWLVVSNRKQAVSVDWPLTEVFFLESIVQSMKIKISVHIYCLPVNFDWIEQSSRNTFYKTSDPVVFLKVPGMTFIIYIELLYFIPFSIYNL